MANVLPPLIRMYEHALLLWKTRVPTSQLSRVSLSFSHHAAAPGSHHQVLCDQQHWMIQLWYLIAFPRLHWSVHLYCYHKFFHVSCISCYLLYMESVDTVSMESCARSLCLQAVQCVMHAAIVCGVCVHTVGMCC